MYAFFLAFSDFHSSYHSQVKYAYNSTLGDFCADDNDNGTSQLCA